MKERDVRQVNLEEGPQICFNCTALATRSIICGSICQSCCDGEDCIRSTSSEVLGAYDSYPSDFRMPDGFQVVRLDAQRVED